VSSPIRPFLAVPAVFLAGAIVACGGNDDAAARAAPEERVLPVEVAVAALGEAARTVTVTGAVEPIRSVGINSQLAGAVLAVAVEEGSRVRSGTVLARLDGRELAAQLTSAEMALEVARRTADRAEQLRQQDYITAAEHDRDQAAFAAAQATRDQLRTRLGYATVRSPVSGVVLEKRIEAGDIVAGQTRLFTIGELSTLVVRVPVSELDVSALAVGDSVPVALDALAGRPLAGRVRRIFPSADTLTRLVPVEVALTGPGASEARPGFLARLTFRLRPRTGVLLVPAGAVIEGAGGAAVYVAANGRATRRAVRRGDVFQGRVEIREGLTPGDTVIVAGATTVRDGAAIRIVSSPSAPEPSSRPAIQPSVGGER
jgi:RND family efflux transporter MFP subunit